MALTQRLEIRQSHALVMTPQLMQAIKLLQLSNLDLAAYVEGELERNPLLERAGRPRRRERRRLAKPRRSCPTADWTQATVLQDEGSRDRAARRRPRRRSSRRRRCRGLARQWRGAARRYSEWAGAGSGRREDGDYNLEAFVSAETTLADHLAEQLALAIADPARRMIGQYLIDLVDEAGYLAGDLALVAEKLGAPVSEVEAVLAILQGFDPPGVCARNLTECLAIQLKERDRFDPAMQALVAHLDLLAKRDLAALRRICGVGEEDSTDMIGEIRQLNPKPGLAFGSVAGAADRARCVRALGPDGGFARRAQFRHAAQGAGQPELSCRTRQDREERQGQEPISPIVCRPRLG